MLFTSSAVAVRSIVISVPFCMFVCLFVYWHVSKTTRPNFMEFSVHVTRGHDLRMTSCFHLTGHRHLTI